MTTTQDKGHSRIPSVDDRRVKSPRRRTIGPLDLEESPLPILSEPTVAPNAVELTHDFSALLAPSHFTTLSPATLPLRPQPPPETPLTTLLTQGYFRSAAIKASSLLQNVPGRHHAEIFRLWYIRLASLCLIGLTDIAANEVKHLQDFNAEYYKDAHGRHLVPWELRVLAVRLHAIAFEDWRRAVGMYYELAKECRIEIGRAETENGRETWRRRLAELGIRVGGTLIEMGDWEAAGRHLIGLLKGDEAEDSPVKDMLALLYLRMGDLESAKEYMGGDQKVLEVFCLMADGQWEEAVKGWRELISDKEAEHGEYWAGEEMVRQNLGVCLLYTGNLSEARELLENLVERSFAFYGLTFNLATIFELCSDSSAGLKRSLAEKVAASGKELPNSSFKITT